MSLELTAAHPILSDRRAPTRRSWILSGAALGFIAFAVVIAVRVPTRATPAAAPSSQRNEDASTAQSQGNDVTLAQVRQVGGDESWWEAVSADIDRREYEPSATPAGFAAPNRAQNLRTRFGARGIEVEPRTAKSTVPAWRFGWKTRSFGRPGRMQEVSPSAPSAAGARVIYRREGWSEWYENTAKGLEQGFTIDRRPEGEGALQIVGQVSDELTPQPRTDGAIDFIDSQGACVIRYGELRAWDAQGVELVANLVSASGGLSIVVDDRDAAYPVTVDPLMTSPSWTGESNQAGAQFGFSVATAGDVNGDGYSDVIVGASFYDNGQIDEGRAYVYQGSASGLSSAAAWAAEGDQFVALYGFSVATAGDVNGDGYSDVIVGAPLSTNGQSAEGRAYVYQGSAAGLESTPAWIAESDQADASFGYSLATAGDVNGDGYSDVIIAAEVYDNGQLNEGRAYVYQGSASGLGSTPAWIAESDQANAHFGYSLATAGDVNGDGYSDVIVGATFYANGEANEGRAYVYQGSASGLGSTPTWTAESNQVGANFGNSVATAGDVNGDGYSDVIVGAYSYDNGQSNQGRSFAYYGSAAGLATTPAWTAEVNQANVQFGTSVATAGDVNGDGYSDVIVGALNYSGGHSLEGRAFVYHGSAAGLLTFQGWSAESNQVNAQFGRSVATAGDVNGDGFSDVIVGAASYDNFQMDEGRAYVYLGAATSLANVPQWTGQLNQTGMFFGAPAAGAGDVNGDGFSDVIVAASSDNADEGPGQVIVYHGSATGISTNPSWTWQISQGFTEYGTSLGTAGDVNGDGFADVLVGVYGYDNDQTDEGIVYLFLGSPSGLAATPAWSAEGNQDGAKFGFSAGAAGDINRDGFSDVVVGSPEYDNGQVDEGRAFLYCGSPAGLLASPSWTAESNQADAKYGRAVGTAGDMDGDGFPDVVVGAPDFNLTGAAFVYRGSPTGLQTFLGPILPGFLTEDFGHSAKTAGDVNGDGYSDVIVGDWAKGTATIYAGPDGSHFWDDVAAAPEDAFGWSVSCAGDVNGDGYSDVLVGAYGWSRNELREGAAFVWHGSPLGPTFGWLVESRKQGAFFGWSVDGVGDVNGDGYSDVVVGAPYYPYAQGTGKAFVYLGNGNLGGAPFAPDGGSSPGTRASSSGVSSASGVDGVLLNAAPLHRNLVRGHTSIASELELGGVPASPRQLRIEGSPPIAVLGTSNSPTAFRLKVQGRAPAGRSRIRLQWEVKPAAVPFDGTNLGLGPQLDTGTPGSPVELSELATGLTPGTLYHWRVRVLSDSPYFPQSRWMWLPDNAPSEADLRTAPGAASTNDVPVAMTHLLESSVPNPFVGETRLTYTVAEAGRVRLAVYDVQGRQVALLSDGLESSGRKTVRWDGRRKSGEEVPAGIYFLRLETVEGVVSQKLVREP